MPTRNRNIVYRGLASLARRTGVAPYLRRARKRRATDVFSEWAARGRDEGMQAHHEAAVAEMLAAAFEGLDTRQGFTGIDAGCGNGWVVRRLRETPGCRGASGVDGSAGMIEKARAIDPSGDYVCADLTRWRPAQPVDLVFSMEVIYYLRDPVALLRSIAREWLKPGGRAVFGIDHYRENVESLSWPRDLRVHMTTWSEARWRAALEEAGFTLVRSWRADARPGRAGTLAMLVRSPEPALSSRR